MLSNDQMCKHRSMIGWERPQLWQIGHTHSFIKCKQHLKKPADENSSKNNDKNAKKSIFQFPFEYHSENATIFLIENK